MPDCSDLSKAILLRATRAYIQYRDLKNKFKQVSANALVYTQENLQGTKQGLSGQGGILQEGCRQ